MDASGADLPDNLGDKVRASLAEEYGRGHFSRDGWAGEVYDVDSDAAVTGEIADDIDALNDAENVEGLGRLLSKEAGEESSGGGSYLAEVRELSPSASDDPTKGAALELRAARAESPAPDSSDVLRLDYEPDVDFTELSDSELRDVAEKVFGQRDTSLVSDYLVDGSDSRDIELDAFRESEGGSMEVYVESKNRKEIRRDDIEPQIVRYIASQQARGADLDTSSVTVYTRTQRQADRIDGFYDGDWFSAEQPPEAN